MKILSFVVFVIIVIIGISFACLNAQPATINFYLEKMSLPLSLIIVLSLGGGCLLGLFAGIGVYLRLKKQNAKLKHRAKIAEMEISNIRSMPLRDAH